MTIMMKKKEGNEERSCFNFMSYANIAEEKELAKLMFENKNMTDFMPLHCFCFKVSSSVQQQ